MTCIIPKASVAFENSPISSATKLQHYPLHAYLHEDECSLILQVVGSCKVESEDAAILLFKALEKLAQAYPGEYLSLLLQRPLTPGLPIETVFKLVQQSLGLLEKGHDLLAVLEGTQLKTFDELLQHLMQANRNTFALVTDQEIHALRKAFTTKNSTVEFPISPDVFDRLALQLKETYLLIVAREQWGLDRLALFTKEQAKTKTLSTPDLLSIGYLALSHLFALKPHTTQVLTVLALLDPQIEPDLKGSIAQVRTGEGKTLLKSLGAFVLAMQQRRVDIFSPSPYLAVRDQKKYAPFFDCFGITTSHICEHQVPDERFKAQIVYGTNYNFEFAYLRAKLLTSLGESKKGILERGTDCALVDEVDNMFVDIAMNSARIAIPKRKQNSWLWPVLIEFVKSLESKLPFEAQKDLLFQRYPSFLSLFQKIPKHTLSLWLTSAWSSLHEKHEGVDYVVHKSSKRGNKTKSRIVIVDKDRTGRRQVNSQWSHGLHQLVACKHGLDPDKEDLMPASISHAVYFSMYKNIYGLTGTMGELYEREEIASLYSLSSFDVPPHRPYLGEMQQPVIVDTFQELHDCLSQQIKVLREQQLPSLILFPTINGARAFETALNRAQIPCTILVDTASENEEYIIECAGQKGKVTIATNTGRRGIDILLNEEARQSMGLTVKVAFYPENYRTQFQAFGRAARQGQPGKFQMVLCRECPTVRTFLNTLDGELPTDSGSTLELLTQNRSIHNMALSLLRRQRAQREKTRDTALSAITLKFQIWMSEINRTWIEKTSEHLAHFHFDSIDTSKSLPKTEEALELYTLISELIAGKTTSKIGWQAALYAVHDLFIQQIQEDWALNVCEPVDLIRESGNFEKDIKELTDAFLRRWDMFIEQPKLGFKKYLSTLIPQVNWVETVLVDI